jgi:small subunit ribosomal protein S3Ae
MAVKKQWYEVVSPPMFGSKVIGETLSADAKGLIGRKMDVSLVELSKDFSKFYFKVTFQVDRIEENKAVTKLVGQECMRERIYRMVQRHGRKVEVVQDVTTKDGINVRIKTVFMLIKRVGSSTKEGARKAARDMIISKVISGDIQHTVRKECSKVYPIGSLEIRKTEMVREKVAAA